MFQVVISFRDIQVERFNVIDFELENFEQNLSERFRPHSVFALKIGYSFFWVVDMLKNNITKTRNDENTKETKTSCLPACVFS